VQISLTYKDNRHNCIVNQLHLWAKLKPFHRQKGRRKIMQWSHGTIFPFERKYLPLMKIDRWRKPSSFFLQCMKHSISVDAKLGLWRRRRRGKLNSYPTVIVRKPQKYQHAEIKESRKGKSLQPYWAATVTLRDTTHWGKARKQLNLVFGSVTDFINSSCIHFHVTFLSK